LERSSTAPVIAMPAHSASKARVNVLAGMHVFTTSQQRKGVDGRDKPDKPGHDGGYVIA
jgi:hypothetical protein